jgi:hypothetical protein
MEIVYIVTKSSRLVLNVKIRNFMGHIVMIHVRIVLAIVIIMVYVTIKIQIVLMIPKLGLLVIIYAGIYTQIIFVIDVIEKENVQNVVIKDSMVITAVWVVKVAVIQDVIFKDIVVNLNARIPTLD